MTYDFDQKLKEGQDGENLVFDYFRSLGWGVSPTGMDYQRKGIDAFVIQGDTKTTIEVKCDAIAWKTKNAFIETVSVDIQNKPGWGYSSQADWLVYLIPPAGMFYLIRMSWIRSNLPEWEQTLVRKPVNSSRNGVEYRSHGLLLPLTEFQREAQRSEGLPKQLVNARAINY